MVSKRLTKWVTVQQSQEGGKGTSHGHQEANFQAVGIASAKALRQGTPGVVGEKPGG